MVTPIHPLSLTAFQPRSEGGGVAPKKVDTRGWKIGRNFVLLHSDKESNTMKKLFLLLFFLSVVSMALADWTINGCHFVGDRPSKSLAMNNVRVWYNGTLRHTHTTNGIQYWEGTNEICVLYPKKYSGPNYVFLSTGGMVQVQHEQ